MAKPLMLLVVATLCCCLITADAFLGCHCLRTIKKPVPYRLIKKIEMIGISGHCRQPETILTKTNGSKMCIDPNQEWFKFLLTWIEKNTGKARTTTTTTTTTTTIAPTNF